ncbi:glycoside hydrolase family 3 N-terminal domain-containing protein [Paenibacillus sp. 7523-1]|uniref:glycoside hydrolase family 3 N-terminal domain-containing protein n=1 Tax=Paenibacillus sp. 7523-1 TaxID=2022550 RepID=UPI000BA64331|nr:glycoside hydrolase family 3 N-terminal domain-containing protein [Paenibacillus sp. 7523-1]PAD28708.1 beta-glucosidase [Paenibacillus sp. 7523-1]
MSNYKDTELTVEARVENLLSKMTLEQKIAQLQCTIAAGSEPVLPITSFPNGIGEVAAFTKGVNAKEVAEENQSIINAFMANDLEIPPIIHNEAITGLSAPDATIFPSAIGLGATFNPETVQKMADIIREQMMAVGYRQALSPVMDICRDPRWGRIGETYGEDPTLAAAMSVAFTKGLQSDDLRNGVAATGKHFLGYGLSEGGLNMTTNPIPARELREVYAKPFQAAISEAGLQSIMNSYGVIDGEMIVGSEHVLNDLLRDEMAFDGVVVSDYTSIEHLVDRYLEPSMSKAGVTALKAGLDVECPYPQAYTVNNLVEAIERGELDETVIDRAVRRVLSTKFKLGLFEDPHPRVEKQDSAYYNPANEQHSLKAALESTILLKNDGLLPLSKATSKIAVIGPHGNSVRLMFGGYTRPAGLEMMISRSMGDMAGLAQDAGFGDELSNFDGPEDNFVPADPFPGSSVLREHPDAMEAIQALYGSVTPTILAAIQEKCPEAEVIYAKGCDIAGNDRSMFEEAIDIAKEADVVILTLGGKYGWGGSCTIGEGIDSDDIGLTGIQEELAKEVVATGTPAVMVHMDARPLSSEFIAENFSAVIEYWFPGTTGGSALANILFGEYNPAGRLPVTAARHTGQIPVFSGQYQGNGYQNTKIILNKYVDSTKEPLFHFGHGLSYTKFEYSDIQIDSETTSDGTVTVSCKLKNVGEMNGEEVVQVYVTDELASMIRPAKELAGFARVFLAAGQEKTVQFEMRADQFAFLSKEMEWIVEEGDMTVRLGSSSADLRLEGKFRITNTARIVGHKRGFFAKSITF